jgi:hypothetical protein
MFGAALGGGGGGRSSVRNNFMIGKFGGGAELKNLKKKA